MHQKFPQLRIPENVYWVTSTVLLSVSMVCSFCCVMTAMFFLPFLLYLTRVMLHVWRSLKSFTPAGKENAVSWRTGLALATFNIIKLYSSLSRLLFKRMRSCPSPSHFIHISRLDPHWAAGPHVTPCSSGSAGNESACNAGALDSVPGLGGSPGEGNGTHSSVLA